MLRLQPGASCGKASGALQRGKGAGMAQQELRRKLRAFPTGSLIFRMLTRY